MSERKKILFVINTLGRAGAERALIELLRVLDPLQYQIYLYVLIPRGELFSEIPDYVTILNKRTDDRSVLTSDAKRFILRKIVRASFHGRSFRKMAGRLMKHSVYYQKGNLRDKIEKYLRRILADGTPPITGKFDLAVAYLEGAPTWYVAEKICACRKVAFVHVDYKRAGYMKELDEGCYENYDRIFAVSLEVKNNFLSVYPEYQNKTFLFYNIIAKETIRKKALLPGGFTDNYKGFRILTVGRLHYQKGYDIAIQTAYDLVRKGYEFRWYVLGEGNERKNLKRLIHEKYLENRFILLGATDNPYPFYHQADLYVCTSRFEGKSIAIEEAQIMGKAIVACECTGIKEQISSEVDGIVVPPEPDQLARKIAYMIQNEKERERIGESAQKREMPFQKGLDRFLEILQGREG